MLPKEFLVVYENVLRRFLHEVEDAHYEHQANRNREEYLDHELWDQVVGDLTQKENNDGDDAKEPNYVGKLHEKSILQKVILFSVDGVNFEGNLFALHKNLLVLLLGHALLKVVLVQSVPSQVRVPLPRRIGLYDYSIGHTYRNFKIFLHTSKEVSSRYFVVRISKSRVPILVESLLIITFSRSIVLSSDCEYWTWELACTDRLVISMFNYFQKLKLRFLLWIKLALLMIGSIHIFPGGLIISGSTSLIGGIPCCWCIFCSIEWGKIILFILQTDLFFLRLLSGCHFQIKYNYNC